MSSSDDREDSLFDAVTAWGSEVSIGMRGEEGEKGGLINDTEASVSKQYQSHQIVGKQGALQASASIVKAVVGAASFGLPWAFLQAGLFGGILGIIILATLSCYTIHMLIKCKNSLPDIEHRVVTYVDIANEVFGRPVAWALYGAIVITSIGACSAYLVFCGDMLETVSGGRLEVKYWVLILAGPLTLFTWIRSFRYLSYTSIVGDIALVLAMVAVFVEGFQEKSLGNPFTDYEPLEYLSYPKFFGASAFLFCIHMLMVPIEQSMKRPKHFQRTTITTFFFVTILNLTFATIAFMLYRDKTEDIIINNLPDNIFVSIARVALVFDLFFTFIVVIVPARDIIENSILKPNRRLNTVYRCIIRTLMVAVCVGIAVSIKQFSDLVGLVSGLSLAFSAFILPPMLHLKLFWSSLGWFTVATDIGLIVFGVVAAVTTTTVSAISVVKDYN